MPSESAFIPANANYFRLAQANSSFPSKRSRNVRFGFIVIFLSEIKLKGEAVLLSGDSLVNQALQPCLVKHSYANFFSEIHRPPASRFQMLR
jgi:hypothetical protein